MLLPMAPGIDNNKKKYQETDAKENHHSGTIFPY